MKTSLLAGILAVSAVLAAGAAGGAMAQDLEHDHAHAASAPSQGKAADAGTMDMKAMCDMHKEMMSSHSRAERRAMMDEKMKGLSASEKKKRLKMMDKQCK